MDPTTEIPFSVSDVMASTDILDYISYPIELLINLAGIAAMVFLIFIANRLREFHLNLRFLLTIACFLFLTISVTRVFGLISKVIPGMDKRNSFAMFVILIHDDAFVAFTVTLLLATFERLLATLSISTYEQRFQSKAYLFFVVVLLVALVASLEVFIDGGIRKNSINIFIPLMACISVTSLLINLCSYYFNKRCVGATITAALSHKYQLKENLSALTVLMPISSMWSIVNIVQILCLVVMYSRIFRDPQYRILIKCAAHLFNQVSALFILTAPLLLIHRHPRFRRRCEMILCKRERPQLTPPRMSPKTEAEVYFRALSNSLNQVTPSKR
ncbi:hypothetical protein Y032_0015g2781 [Ancylostoma ceylanicum]|uniref:G-protein coupled receptors family 1 profile domain-containing protein n=1 Tax=Ancylostoma ceylanicum TaxID=53326 RepID=A0A016V8S5_9BILA|nr:hypothetical protein Y032_0015g2781 [Ancylostoma ceylanicum]